MCNILAIFQERGEKFIFLHEDKEQSSLQSDNQTCSKYPKKHVFGVFAMIEERR